MPLDIKKGSELLDRYVISDCLGSGGFGIVWRATDKKAGRDVAIKRMLKQHGDENARLLAEAKKTAALKGHKNIVEVYEVFEHDGEGFLVMEYVDGTTLENIMKRHVREKTWIELDEALDYYKQTLQALVFAHSSGLYHRDIKPANILVSKLGVVKLVDFGIARLMHQPGGKYVGEPGFAWTGTPNFMSPEQANGADLDHQTDIFSVGILGYILLTGRHPFNHPSGIATVFDLIKDPTFECEDIAAQVGKRVPEGFAKALMRMLRKTKSDRCQSLIEPLSELTKEPAQSCPKCGAPNPKTHNFCCQCGSPLRPTQPTLTMVAKDQHLPRNVTAEELTDEGFKLTQNDDWVGAVRKYKEAIAADPKYVRAFSNLGFALNSLGKYDDAIQILTEATALTKEKPVLHRIYDYRGFSKSNLKDYEGAIEDFTKAIGLADHNPRVYHHRAESKALAGKYDEAYSDVLQALRLDPGYPPAIRLKQKLESQGFVKPI
ncbi:MAG: protein kinase [Verrucomicrobia bacterium]|nr:protein kinase [Verrucomicrobiota bacterium]